MIALDANVLIALLDRRDAHHEPALRLTAAERLVAHRLSVAEALVVPARLGAEARAWATLRAADVELAPADDLEPLRIARLRSATGLRMADCCVLHAAMGSGASVATFDAAVAKAAVRLGIPVVSAA